MNKEEKAVWLKAIRMDLETIRAAVSNITAQLAIINIALKEIEEYMKHLEQ